MMCVYVQCVYVQCVYVQCVYVQCVYVAVNSHRSVSTNRPPYLIVTSSAQLYGQHEYGAEYGHCGSHTMTVSKSSL